MKEKQNQLEASMKGKGEVRVGRELPWQRTVICQAVPRVRLLL